MYKDCDPLQLTDLTKVLQQFVNNYPNKIKEYPDLLKCIACKIIMAGCNTNSFINSDITTKVNMIERFAKECMDTGSTNGFTGNQQVPSDDDKSLPLWAIISIACVSVLFLLAIGIFAYRKYKNKDSPEYEYVDVNVKGVSHNKHKNIKPLQKSKRPPISNFESSLSFSSN